MIRRPTFALLLATFALSSPAFAANFQVSTFNVEWYGLGGKMEGNPSDEKRDATIQDVISQSISGSDIIVFEEVVDVQRLANNIAPKNWNCKSYTHSNPKHQHVVICAKPELKLLREPSDNNDIIDDVAKIGASARPALHLIVADQNKNPLFRLIGVHLKAQPDKFKERQTQAEYIADYISKLDSDLPVVITGDFNTYMPSETGQKKDDASMISEVWKDLDLKEVTGKFNTYLTLQHANHFDRFWLSKSLQSTSMKVLKNCQYDSSKPDEAKKISWYNSNVSDHCPVSLSFKL